MSRVQNGIPIGELLIHQGVLTEKQVEHILTVQKVSHRPFGDLAERLFGVDPKLIEDAWVEQYIRTAGVTDLNDLAFDADCLRLINRRQAWQFHLLPACRTGEHLHAATDAEHLIKSVNFASRRIDEAVFFLIADRRQLREFLMKYYPVPEHIAQFAERM